MTERINPLVQGDEKATFPSALNHALADSTIQQLPRCQNAVLSLGQTPDNLRRRSIPHLNPAPTRTASDFLPARPEI